MMDPFERHKKFNFLFFLNLIFFINFISTTEVNRRSFNRRMAMMVFSITLNKIALETSLDKTYGNYEKDFILKGFKVNGLKTHH